MNTAAAVARFGLLIALLVTSGTATAQTPNTVEGRIVDALTGAPIQNAVVDLGDGGSTLSNVEGRYRVVVPTARQYTMTVRVIGYTLYETDIQLSGLSIHDVRLEISPIALDPVDATVRRITVRGTVRDTVRGYSIVDASVATSLGHSTETNSHGRFRLRDVFEASPFSIRIRVFGYLPVEREILPGDGDDYDFALTEDPIVAGRIAERSVRLVDRASPRFSVGRPNLNREQILRYAGAHTVFDMLLFRYGERKLDAVSCVVIDERPFMANGETQAMLYGLLPEQVERVEFMFRGQMIRLYTRDFLREMISRDVKLRAPAIFPICQ